ncbi:MAG: arginine--tRNA ligase [Nitriliruptoraceae bacterium]
MARPERTDPVLAALDACLRDTFTARSLPDVEPELERPKIAEHGDWATSAALRMAKQAGRPPRDVAQEIVDHLQVPDVVAEVSIAGPGFVNFRFAHRYHEDLVRRIVASGAGFGQLEPDGRRETINIEFVSANPTGPLHVGAGRWAATGDAIAALVEASGHEVVREYYVNDAGEQIRRFGESVVLVDRGAPLGDEHYRGAVVGDIAARLRAAHDGRTLDEVAGAVAPTEASVVDPDVGATIGSWAVEVVRGDIESVLERMGVHYDVWYSEQQGLHESGAIEATLDALRASGTTYEQDGALFLSTSAHGDDKDRVLVRSDGRPTYFAADCAYLRDKWERSDRLFYLLGADHHGYVARVLAAAECLGIPRERVEIRIGQLVNLLRGGEPVRMSKRSGTTIDLSEVLDEVGVDVTRYHFLRQGLDTTVDFDLDVVAQQSMDNPVYYVQYAHARISSLIRTADDRGFDHGPLEDADLTILVHPAELELLRAMAQLPAVVAEAAELRATQRLARYAEELAATFHRFYGECRVLVEGAEDGSDPEAVRVSRARYWLAVASRQVLANALDLLRVDAPDRM